MRRIVIGTSVLAVVISLGAASFQARQVAPPGSRLSNPTASPNTGLRASYGRLPLSFEANVGQTDRRVKFVSHSAGQTLFLAPTEAVVVLNQPRTVLRMKLVGGP